MQIGIVGLPGKSTLPDHHQNASSAGALKVETHHAIVRPDDRPDKCSAIRSALARCHRICRCRRTEERRNGTTQFTTNFSEVKRTTPGRGLPTTASLIRTDPSTTCGTSRRSKLNSFFPISRFSRRASTASKSSFKRCTMRPPGKNSPCSSVAMQYSRVNVRFARPDCDPRSFIF